MAKQASRTQQRRSRTAPKRRGERASRDDIQEVARVLFAERGPDAVTMSEVAEAAGVARATVFNHFGSKHALIEAITERVLLRYQEALDAAVEAKSVPTVVLLRGLFEFMGRGVAEDRRFHHAVFREIAKLGLGHEEGGPGMRARERNLATLSQLILRGQARGEFLREVDADALASALDSLCFGTITHWLYADASEPLHARMSSALEIVLRPTATEPDVEGTVPAALVIASQKRGRPR